MYDSNNFGVSDDFEYHEIIIDSRDALSQYSPNYTSLNWPKIFLGKELERVAAVKVLQVIIPKTYYPINSTNNRMDFWSWLSPTWTNRSGGAGYAFNPGYYSVSSLTTEFKRVLDLVWNPWIFTPTYSNIKQKWTSIPTNLSPSFTRWLMMGFRVSSTTADVSAQSFEEVNNNARTNPRKILGYEGGAGSQGPVANTVAPWIRGPNFSSVGVGAKSFGEAPFVTQLEPTSIYLNSKTLGSMINNIHLNGAGHLVTPGTGADEEQVCSIPVPSSITRGENIIYSDPDPQKWFRFGGNLSFPTTFDFYLTSGVNIEPLDLNGSSFVIKLGVLTNKREFERTFPTSTNGGYSRVRNLIVTK